MPGSESQEVPHFLVLWGEGANGLTPDQVEVLRDTASAMAGGRTVEATVTLDVASAEPARRAESSIIHLTNMTPDDAIQMHADIYAVRHDAAATFDLLAQAFDYGLEVLPEEAPERAVSIYTALAHAEEGEAAEDARTTIAISIVKLAKANPEAALTLWQKLLKDPSEEVANRALESAEDALEYGIITPEQALRLVKVHKKAWPKDTPS